MQVPSRIEARRETSWKSSTCSTMGEMRSALGAAVLIGLVAVLWKIWPREAIDSFLHERAPGAPSTAVADAAPKVPAANALRVLFVGNSHTYMHEMPRMLAQLAAADRQPRSFEFVMDTPGGSTLPQHVASNEAARLLHQGGWDYMVLQDQQQASSLTQFPEQLERDFFGSNPDAGHRRAYGRRQDRPIYDGGTARRQSGQHEERQLRRHAGPRQPELHARGAGGRRGAGAGRARRAVGAPRASRLRLLGKRSLPSITRRLVSGCVRFVSDALRPPGARQCVSRRSRRARRSFHATRGERSAGRAPLSLLLTVQREGGALWVVAHGDALATGPRKWAEHHALAGAHTVNRQIEVGDAHVKEPVRVATRAARNVGDGAGVQALVRPGEMLEDAVLGVRHALGQLPAEERRVCVRAAIESVRVELVPHDGKRILVGGTLRSDTDDGAARIAQHREFASIGKRGGGPEALGASLEERSHRGIHVGDLI